MAFKVHTRHQPSEKPTAFDIRQAAEETGQVLDQFTGRPQLESTLLEENLDGTTITLGTSAVDVPHGLGRDWRGWRITSKDANAVVYEGTQTDKALFLTLLASATVNVKLEVF
jgi:hypothetical protein